MGEGEKMSKFLINEHKEACKSLTNYMQNKGNYYFIHYACENFKDDLPKKGNRIIAIGVLNAKTQSIQLFSMKNSAQILNLNIENASEEDMDKIELHLLDKYFQFLSNHRDFQFIHWRMNNDCYGFESLERRFESLGGDKNNIFGVNESNTINLSLLLKQKYGVNYTKTINNNKGSMYTLFDLNNVQREEILSGINEAQLINEKKYDKVYFSLVAKLYGLYQIVDLAASNKLKTYSKVFKEIYGSDLSGILSYIHDNALLATIFSFIGWILGMVIQYILINNFNINL